MLLFLRVRLISFSCKCHVWFSSTEKRPKSIEALIMATLSLTSSTNLDRIIDSGRASKRARITPSQQTHEYFKNVRLAPKPLAAGALASNLATQLNKSSYDDEMEATADTHIAGPKYDLKTGNHLQHDSFLSYSNSAADFHQYPDHRLELFASAPETIRGGPEQPVECRGTTVTREIKNVKRKREEN